MDGVEAVFTGAQIAKLSRHAHRDTSSLPDIARLRPTSCDSQANPCRSRASDRYVARDAADAIMVSYDSLPAVVDPELAMTGKPAVIHEGFRITLPFPSYRAEPE
jgi:CO/xanthine dehydrogenase Mo-binding subunit